MRSETVRVKISKTEVEALPLGGRIVDTAISGFMARRLPSGKIAYGYRYRMKGKPQQWVSLGVHGVGGVTAETARKAAKSLQGKVADRVDPVREAKAEHDAEVHALRVKRNTVNVVLDRFIKEYVDEKGLRTGKQYERSLELHVRPHIGTLSIYQLTRDDLNPMLRAIAKGAGPVARDRALAHLRKALNWYQIQDSKFTSPIVKGMAGGGSKARDRVLDDDELRSLWAASGDEAAGHETFRRFIRALLLVGQRRTNVASMHADNIKDGIWTIPGEEHKNAHTQYVPLTSAALQCVDIDAGGFLFSTTAGKRPFSGYSKGKAQLDAYMAKQRKEAGLKAMPRWTLHDLRRTARSLMSRAQVPADIAEIATGHKIQGVRGVYDRHTYIDEKRDAFERLAAQVDRIINPPTGNVVQLSGAR